MSFSKGTIGGGYKDHHITFDSFKAAVEQNCIICIRIWSPNKENLGGAPERFRLRYWFVHWTEVKRLTIQTHEAPYMRIELKFLPLEGLAYRWFLSCRACHQSCGWLIEEPKWAPTRLLDIGNVGDSQWKLHISAEEALNAPNYMTLSHCWGSSNLIKLTRLSFSDFLCGKPITELPTTFRDAITVARRFSIRYIWIDSLCIIQDSPEDWRKESSRMHKVYAHSVCNIVAADSRGPEDGLFRTRDAAHVQVFELQPEWTDYPKTNFIVWDDGALSRDLLESPLYKRGWVLQERFLSPRLLHFGEQQIFWRCQKLNASENFPQGIPLREYHVDLQELRNITQSRSLAQSAKECIMPQSAFELWIKILSIYTDCVLTYSDDKLVALSGLAHLFQDRTGDKYLAGLWRSRFCELLCWKVLYTPHGFRPKYRAPSWSWASIDGRIGYPNVKGKHLAIVTDVHIAPVADDIAGQVAGGYAIARGLIFQARLQNMNDSHLDIQIGSTRERMGYAPKAVGPHLFADLGSGAFKEGMIVYLLPLICSVEDVFDDGNNAAVRGLMLQQVSETGDTYSRFGFFDFTDTSKCEMMGISINEKYNEVVLLRIPEPRTVKII
ncbi:heterokaryon incompatibility protein [Rutstroemia sp. NJR-2017a BVV2]|nr:heterokaryon incompatibility protein [Rutstroemia sp. NJR-2017a BVV2]